MYNVVRIGSVYMNPFEIKIDGKTYEYIDSKEIDGKYYVLYADEKNMFISEYEIVDNKIILKEIDNSLLDKLKEAFNIV
jgi:hypothetical protein